MDKLTHSAAEAVAQITRTGVRAGARAGTSRHRDDEAEAAPVMARCAVAGDGERADRPCEHPGRPAAPARSPARRGRGLALPLADALRILDGGRDAGRSWSRRPLDFHPAVDLRIEALLARSVVSGSSAPAALPTVGTAPCDVTAPSDPAGW